MPSELVDQQSVVLLSEGLAKKMRIFEIRIGARLMVEGLAYPLLVEDDESYSIGEVVKNLLGRLEQTIINLNLSGQEELSFRKWGFETIVVAAAATARGLHERFREEATFEVLSCASDYLQKYY